MACYVLGGCNLQLTELVLKEKTWGTEAHDVASLFGFPQSQSAASRLASRIV